MAEKEILIKKATLDDLESIFYLYNNYMFDSYLLKFGSSFVKKYLKIIIESKNCITLVAGENGLAGFIMAAFNGKKILSRLFFNLGILCFYIKQILICPKLILKSLEFILYPFHTYLRNANAELLFISIESAYRKKNLATKLIKEVLSSMGQQGIKKVKVSTIMENEAVNTLLNKLGFKIEKSFRLFRRYMYLYSYEIY